MKTHENYVREEAVEGSSDRTFGLFFAGFFLVLFAIGAYKGHFRIWPAAASAVLLFVALLRPGLLSLLNRAWTRLGLAMYFVVGPVVMLLIFSLTIVPFGLVMRLFGRDVLRLKRPRGDVQTYWRMREPSEAVADSMKHQF